VQVVADLDEFSPGMREKIKNAVDEQTKGLPFEELDKSAEKAGESAADHLAEGVDRKLEPNMEKEGKKGGRGLSRGLSGVVAGLTASLLPALIAFGVGAAAALVPAAVALSATIPAAIFTTVGAIGVLMLATHGLGDALKTAFDPAKAKQFEEAMKKLSPAARAFVLEIKGLRPAFHDLQQDIQETFFTQLQGVLTRVSTKLLPTLRTGLRQLSADIGRMGAGLLNAFGNSKTNLAAVFTAAHEAIKPFIPALGQFVAAFITIGAVAGPLFVTLSGGFAHLLGQFATFIDQAAQSGDLAAFFDTTLVILRQLSTLLGSVFDLVVDLVGALQDSGGDALGILGRLVAALDDFFRSAEGKSTLAAVFGLINTALDSIFQIIVPLLPALGGLISTIAGGLTDALKTVTPYLQDAAEWLGKHPDLLKAAVAAWAIYRGALGLVAIYEAIVLALNPVTWIVLAIAAIAAGAYLIYKNWGVVTHALTVALDAVKGFFSGIWGWIVAVGKDIGNWFTVTLPGFFATLPGKIWAVLSALPGMLWTVFTTALTAAGQAIGVGVGLIIVAVVKIPGLIWDAIKGIGNLFVDLWNLAFALGRIVLTAGINAVVWFFVQLPIKIAGFVARLPGIIGGAFRSAWDWAKREVREGADAVVGFVQRLPGRISGFMRNVGRDILGGLKSGINAVISGFNSGIDRVSSAVHIGLPHLPMLASGGLVTSPTLAIVGEAGKEAVIPMSDPARAQAVAQKTGLLAMLGSRAGHSEMPAVQVFLGTREITDILDVRIDKKMNDQANELAYGTR
jgi:hypothetical protein